MQKTNMSSTTVLQLICAALVAIIVCPIGCAVLSYVDVDPFAFSAGEAVFSATLGFGLAEWLIAPWR
jgi:hypothetical protein